MLNISTIINQPIMRLRTFSICPLEKSQITDKRILKALRPKKALSVQELTVITDSSNTGVHSANNRLIAAGKVERIKNPEQEYGKPSYLFRLV